MFAADRPIQSETEDKLNRKSFAKSLAEAMLKYTSKDSLVIGLYGSWGCGKTSIINMALEQISSVCKEHAYAEPILLKFNPWHYPEQSQLILLFLKQLSAVLRRRDFAGEVTAAAEKLEAYCQLLKPLEWLPDPLISKIPKCVAGVARAASKWGGAKSKELDSTKAELNELLRQQPQKIIVIIDDIDRLKNAEIRQIFQLVKSLADFQNTIYLLAFDKDVVVPALQSGPDGFGQQYLEKVIQVPFDVPLASEEAVETMLTSQLNELLDGFPAERWDKGYWLSVYLGGLKHLFVSVRDINRYINALKFDFALLRDEVNPVDLFALTAIRVLMPDLYHGIRDNQELFCGVSGSTSGRDEQERERRKRDCDELMGRAARLPKASTKKLLTAMFPGLDWVYDDVRYGSESLRGWRKEGRVCSPDMFPTFFRLGVSEGELSQREANAILSAADDRARFTEGLLRLAEDGRSSKFLSRLEDHTDDLPEESMPSIIEALLDIGDLLPDEDRGILSTDSVSRITYIVNALIRRVEAEENRFALVANAIRTAKRGLHTPVREVFALRHEHGKHRLQSAPEPEHRRTISPAHLEDLERLACEKIQAWAEEGRLQSQKHLDEILLAWKEWGGDQSKMTPFIAGLIDGDAGLLDFIQSFMSKVRSTTGYLEEVSWRIRPELIGQFVDLQEIEVRVRRIAAQADFSNLSDEKQLAVKTLLDTLDGKIVNHF